MPEVMTKVDQAAILLLTVGESEAARVLKHLEQREVQRLSEAMTGLSNISTDQIDLVVEDFLGKPPGPLPTGLLKPSKVLVTSSGDRVSEASGKMRTFRRS
mgnify:CR=1 FL=1